MELRQLRHFLALAESRHFGRAAQVAGVSQQALSYSIAQLEKSLNTRLFERNQNATILTASGKLLERRARLICSEARLATGEMLAVSSGTEGVVSFGISSGIASRLLPEVIERYSHTRPKVVLNVSADLSERLYDRLIAGELEFVVAAPRIDVNVYPELEHEKFPGGMTLDSNFLSMRRGHPLLKLTAPRLADAVKYPWLMPATLPDFTDDLFSLFSRQDAVPPRYIVRTDSYHCTYAIIMKTDFVALTGVEAASAQVDAGLIAGFPLQGVDARRPVLMSSRARSEKRVATAALMGIFRSLISANPCK
jgi:DNA-binding transcriptional LysR family regulator